MIRIYDWLCKDCDKITENAIQITVEELSDPKNTKYRTPPENGCKHCGSTNLTKLVATNVRVTHAQGSQKGKMNNQY